MRILITVFFIFYNFQLILSNNAECSYANVDYTTLSSIYRCSVQNQLNIESPGSVEITSVTGLHKNGKTNDDVIGYYADDRNTKYFPRGFENVFKNLKVINIYNGRLKEIRQSDLKQIPQLVSLHLASNDIEILEDGLFDYNTELVYIDLDSNKIFHISANVFDKLIKLTYLYLYSNPCINVRAANSTTAVKNIIQQLNSKCKDSDYISIQNELERLEQAKFYTSFQNFTDFGSDLKKLEVQLNSSKLLKAVTLKRKFEWISDLDLKSNFNLNTKINQIENLITTISNGMSTSLKNIEANLKSELNEKINQIEKSVMTISNEINHIEKCISKVDTELNEKISKLENLVKDALKESSKNVTESIDRNSQALRSIQSNLDDRMQLMNYKMDNNCEVNDFSTCVLYIVCGFLASLVLIIIYKKILFRSTDDDLFG